MMHCLPMPLSTVMKAVVDNLGEEHKDVIATGAVGMLSAIITSKAGLEKTKDEKENWTNATFIDEFINGIKFVDKA